jgi:hypothetical protein
MWQHYYKAMTPQEAEAYWQVRPPNALPNVVSFAVAPTQNFA